MEWFHRNASHRIYNENVTKRDYCSAQLRRLSTVITWKYEISSKSSKQNPPTIASYRINRGKSEAYACTNEIEHEFRTLTDEVNWIEVLCITLMQSAKWHTSKHSNISIERKIEPWTSRRSSTKDTLFVNCVSQYTPTKSITCFSPMYLHQFWLDCAWMSTNGNVLGKQVFMIQLESKTLFF